MRPIQTLRACSKCLQGQRVRYAGLVSSAERVHLEGPRSVFLYTRQRYAGRYGTKDIPKTDPDAPLSYAIQRLSRGSVLTKRKFHFLLARPADIQSLLTFIPFVEAYVQHSSTPDASEVIALLLAKVGESNGLALIPEILRLFQSTTQRDLEPHLRSVSPVDLNHAYLHIFRALGSFFRRNVSSATRHEAQSLHPIIHEHVKALFTALENQLHSLPSTSGASVSRNERPGISKDILELLFTRPFLTMELSGTLMQYCKVHNLKRSSWVWWRCCTVAVDSGHFQTAERYSAGAKKAAKSEAKVRKRETDGKSDAIGAHSVALAREECGDERWSAMVGQEVGRMMRLGSKKEMRAVASILEPYLYETSDPKSGDAWSRLLSAARHDEAVDAALLLSLRQSIVGSAIGSQTLTPVMMGLLEKGDVTAAWDTWQELVDIHRANPWDESKFIDRVALAVGSHVCYAKYGFETTISLVDAWAHKPNSSQPGQRSSGKVKLDAINVNILLQMCRKDRHPSVAFRLFAAAMPRWGVYTDSTSLTLLLDTARSSSKDDGHDVIDIKHRLRELVDELGFRRSSSHPNTPGAGSFDAYDDSGFAKGSASVLLDQAGYVWQDENAAPAWSIANDLFETIVLTNFPWLADVASPLDFQNGPYAHQVRDLSSFFRTRAAQTSDASDPASPLRLPGPDNARHIHIIPTANTFHSYISLLGRYNQTDKISLALAWMRSLGIRPKSQTMLTALMYIQDVEGPRRFFRDWDNGTSRLLGDGEVLRKWLGDWLGKGVPTEEDVAARVRDSMRRLQSEEPSQR